jgi:hypothetical protein
MSPAARALFDLPAHACRWPSKRDLDDPEIIVSAASRRCRTTRIVPSTLAERSTMPASSSLPASGWPSSAPAWRGAREGRPMGVKDAAAPVVALDHDDAPGGLGSGRLTGMGGGTPPDGGYRHNR